MTDSFKVITNVPVYSSPQFPAKEDFDRYGLWCEWHDASELEYIKSICPSESLYKIKFEKPKREGKEVYYPIVGTTVLPDHEFMYVNAVITIASKIQLQGYLAVCEQEVVALTAWVDAAPDHEIDFYRSDRLVSIDENPRSVIELLSHFPIEHFTEIDYKTEYCFSNKEPVAGALQLDTQTESESS